MKELYTNNTQIFGRVNEECTKMVIYQSERSGYFYQTLMVSSRKDIDIQTLEFESKEAMFAGMDRLSKEFARRFDYSDPDDLQQFAENIKDSVAKRTEVIA